MPPNGPGSGKPRRANPLPAKRARREAAPPKEAPAKHREDMTPDELFDALRQGARNVAGVTWQVTVSVHLLVLARAGELPFATVVPEGFEDLDCAHVDGTKTFVQMKEVAGGEGRLAASDIAEALKHARAGARGSVVALVTDGQLGSGLGFTGWNDFLAAQGGKPVDDVLAGLVSRGLTEKQARALVASSRLVHLPWRLRDQTEQRLAQYSVTHPTVASFAVGRLYDELARTAADQRTATLAAARSHPVGDVDAAIADVQSAVDVNGLDIALAAGVCTPANFLDASGMAAGEFYAGVDGAPAHIAARLDVVRPRELAEIRDAACNERYALVLGPSGAGKSVLLWRAARDAVPGARVVRARRIETAPDADLLVRHVRLMRPTPTSPVVVVADNVGRPGMSAWPASAAALREIPSVVLLAACRAEDFHPSLLRGATRLVEPRLDKATSDAVAERAEQAGLTLAMTADEAAALSDGLLMEFLALLTTGQRLEQVLAEQAVGLRLPGRELQRDAARLLTAAHSVGLSLDADRLGGALAGGAGPSLVGDALSVLRDEHIVTRDGRSWSGLHELRSRVLARLLHESPPPTLAATWVRAAALLTPAECGWMLRRVAEQNHGSLPDVATSAAAVAATTPTAAQAAALLEGAERADNAVYAQECKPVLERHLRSGVTIYQLALMAYGVRHQGLTMAGAGGVVDEVAKQLPERSDATAAAVAAGIGESRLSRLLLTAPLVDATRLLEAGAGLLPITPGLARTVHDRFPAPKGPHDAELWARLVQALADSLQPRDVDAAIGDVETRASAAVHADPLAVTLSVDSVGRSASMTIMHSPEPALTEPPAWDSPPVSRSMDLANETAVAAARRLAAACPELETVEVVTVTASGQRYRVAGFEPGHKTMARQAFADRTQVRRSVGFQAALRRLDAARSWTDMLREQIKVATELTALATDAVARLGRLDNDGRSRAWAARAADCVSRTSAMLARPATTGVDLTESHAQVDDAERQGDSTTDALLAVAQALPRLLTENRLIALATTFDDAAGRLLAAAADANPSIAGLGPPIPDGLVLACQRLARVLAALHADPSAARRIRGADPVGGADAIVEQASALEEARQRTILKGAVSSVAGVEMHRLPARRALSSSGTDTWLVLAPVGSWDDLVEALAAIPAETRRDTGARIVAAARDGDRVLPIAIQLLAYGDRTEMPLTAAMLRPYIDGAGLRLADGGDAAGAFAEIVDGLVTASWRCARDRFRPDAWPAADAAGGPVLDNLRQGAAAAGALLDEHSAQAIAAANLLIDHVEQELTGADGPTLAGEVFDAQGGTPDRTGAPDLWNALQILAVAGLDTGGAA